MITCQTNRMYIVSFELLIWNSIVNIICSTDVATMALFSRLSKRFYRIFHDEHVFKKCVVPKMTPKQRLNITLDDVKKKQVLEHDTSDDESIFSLHIKGTTPDGIGYAITWSCDEHEHASIMEDIYEEVNSSNEDSDYDSEDSDVPPPKSNMTKRMEWFMTKYDGQKRYVNGEANFEFPPSVRGEHVSIFVNGLIKYSIDRFEDYLATNGVGSDKNGVDDYVFKMNASYKLPAPINQIYSIGSIDAQYDSAEAVFTAVKTQMDVTASVLTEYGDPELEKMLDQNYEKNEEEDKMNEQEGKKSFYIMGNETSKKILIKRLGKAKRSVKESENMSQEEMSECQKKINNAEHQLSMLDLGQVDEDELIKAFNALSDCFPRKQ